MVKNTTGGSKHKGMARKDVNSHSSRDYVPKDDAEHYALVTKLLGNGMCHVQIFMHDNSILKDVVCHIRGKFRSKNKRHNLITNGSKLVIGLRTWESTLKNCDLLAIIIEFPNSISHLYHNHDNHNHNDNHNDIILHNNLQTITFNHNNTNLTEQTLTQTLTETFNDI